MRYGHDGPASREKSKVTNTGGSHEDLLEADCEEIDDRGLEDDM